MSTQVQCREGFSCRIGMPRRRRRTLCRSRHAGCPWPHRRLPASTRSKRTVIGNGWGDRRRRLRTGSPNGSPSPAGTGEVEQLPVAVRSWSRSIAAIAAASSGGRSGEDGGAGGAPVHRSRASPAGLTCSGGHTIWGGCQASPRERPHRRDTSVDTRTAECGPQRGTYVNRLALPEVLRIKSRAGPEPFRLLRSANGVPERESVVRRVAESASERRQRRTLNIR